MERIEDTEIRIAYENRCYGDIIVAVEKDIKKAIHHAKEEIIRELESYELEHRVNVNCSWYDVQKEYDFLIKSLRKRHLSNSEPN